MFLSYLEDVKKDTIYGFKMCIISRDIVSNEIGMTHKSRISECESACSHDGEKANIVVKYGRKYVFGFLQNDELDDHINEK